jgi:hypothetical protein
LRVLNEKRKFTEPRRPWYVDTPAWYPGPSPWAPGNGAEGSKVTVGQGEEAEKEGDPYPQAA